MTTTLFKWVWSWKYLLLHHKQNAVSGDVLNSVRSLRQSALAWAGFVSTQFGKRWYFSSSPSAFTNTSPQAVRSWWPKASVRTTSTLKFIFLLSVFFSKHSSFFVQNYCSVFSRTKVKTKFAIMLSFCLTEDVERARHYPLTLLDHPHPTALQNSRFRLVRSC